MTQFLNSILPIIILFIIGFITKKLQLFNSDNADTFIKMAFYLSLPAVILEAIPRITLGIDLIILPIIAIIVHIVTFVCAFLIGTKLGIQMDQKTLGVFIISSLIMNTGFNLPFILTFLGTEGVALTSIFDIGNSIMTLTLAYSVAVYYSDNGVENGYFQKQLLSKLLSSPPIWALFIAISLNLFSVSYHPALSNLLGFLSGLLTPLIMIALGIYFEPEIIDQFTLYIPLIIRIGIGSIVGLVFVLFLGFQGLIAIVIVIGCAAPI